MHRFCVTYSALLVLSAAVSAQDDAPAAVAFAPLDPAKIDRRIAAVPKFVGTPLYALFAFGPKGDKLMWAVLDKTAADVPHYDVLYFDKNANGDLTEEDERIVSKFDEKRARAGLGISLRIEKLPIPGTDLVHEDLLISTVRKKGRTGIWFRMKWNGVTELSGGYGPAGMNCTTWRKSPATAPVLRPTPRAPLSFATWGSDPVRLRIGGSTHLNVIVGSRGIGPDTLAVVDEHFLDLDEEELWVTVIGVDEDGKRVETRSRIREHC